MRFSPVIFIVHVGLLSIMQLFVQVLSGNCCDINYCLYGFSFPLFVVLMELWQVSATPAVTVTGLSYLRHPRHMWKLILLQR